MLSWNHFRFTEKLKGQYGGSPHTLHTASSDVHIVHNQSPVTKAKKFVVVHYCQVNYRPCLDITRPFQRCSFSVPGSSLGSRLVFNCQVTWISPVSDSSSVFVFYNFDTFEGTGFCRLSLSLGLLGVFSLDWVYAFLADTAEVMHLSQCIVTGAYHVAVSYIAGDTTLDHLVKVMSSGFLRCEVIIFFFVVNKPLGERRWD